MKKLCPCVMLTHISIQPVPWIIILKKFILKKNFDVKTETEYSCDFRTIDQTKAIHSEHHIWESFGSVSKINFSIIRKLISCPLKFPLREKKFVNSCVKTWNSFPYNLKFYNVVLLSISECWKRYLGYLFNMSSVFVGPSYLAISPQTSKFFYRATRIFFLVGPYMFGMLRGSVENFVRIINIRMTFLKQTNKSCCFL